MDLLMLTLAQASEPQMSAAPPSGGDKTVIGLPNAPVQGTPTTATQGAPVATPTTTPGGAPPASFPPVFLLIFVVFGAFILMTWLSQRKEQKKTVAMLASMKRGDKVATIGGVIGTIAEMSDDEIVLRVEEGRIRFAKSAVRQVLTPRSGPVASVEAKDAKNGKPEVVGAKG